MWITYQVNGSCLCKKQYNTIKENKTKNELKASCFLFEPDHIRLIHARQVERN